MYRYLCSRHMLIEWVKLAEHLQQMPMMGGWGTNKKLVNTFWGLPLVPQMNSQASLAFLTLSSAVES